mgnify:CR=1 FL=1|tara:strand:+ start:2490 stop:2849 length:360 start_codon:yes stop_codon:yes gene_type:complete
MAASGNKNTDSVPTYLFDNDLEQAGVFNILNSTTGRVYAITLSCSSGTAYLKGYDAKSFTAGTTDPVLVFKYTGATPTTIVSKAGIPFNTALSIGGSNTGGRTAGSVPPSSLNVTVIGD